jgi:hypothetical protein
LDGKGKVESKSCSRRLGEITGINGQLVVFLAGVAMVVAALGYALKAYQEALRFEHGLKDAIRHFAP